MTIFEDYISEYLQRVSREYNLGTLYDFGGNISLDLKSLNEFLNYVYYYTGSDICLDLIKYTKEQDIESLNECRNNIRILCKLGRINVETVQLASLTFENSDKYISNTDIEKSLSYYSKSNIDRLKNKTLDLNVIDKIQEVKIEKEIKDLKINDNSIIIIDLNYKTCISNELLRSIVNSIKNKNNIILLIISDEQLDENIFQYMDSRSINLSSKNKHKYKMEYLYIYKNGHKESESLSNIDLLDF